MKKKITTWKEITNYVIRNLKGWWMFSLLREKTNKKVKRRKI